MPRGESVARGAEPASVRAWIEASGIRVLNVAGPGESKSPGIYEKTRELLQTLFSGGANAEAGGGTAYGDPVPR